MRHISVCSLALALGGCVSSPQLATPHVKESLAQTVERAKWLAAHIDDEPIDCLHADLSRSGDELIDIGEAAILPTLELMLSDGQLTRIRAERVLCTITMYQYGRHPQKGWKDEASEKAWRKLWDDLGYLEWNATEERRKASVALWKKHFEKSAGE